MRAVDPVQALLQVLQLAQVLPQAERLADGRQAALLGGQEWALVPRLGPVQRLEALLGVHSVLFRVCVVA